VQLDTLYTVLSAMKAGKVSEAESTKRLDRSFHWARMAMDLESPLLRTIAVGDWTLGMAQHVVHRVAHMLAPDGVPCASPMASRHR
jgi:hypothetical protein